MAPAGEFSELAQGLVYISGVLGLQHGLLSSYPSLKCCELPQILHTVRNGQGPPVFLLGSLVDIWSGLNIFRLSGIEHCGSARPVPCEWVALPLMAQGKGCGK